MHPGYVLGVRYHGLRGRHHVEQGALPGVGVSPHNGRARSVAEQCLGNEGVEGVRLDGPAKNSDGELDADHEDAGATVILGEVLGEAQRSGPSGAAVELERRAADIMAETKEGDEADVSARRVRSRVGGDDEVGLRWVRWSLWVTRT